MNKSHVILIEIILRHLVMMKTSMLMKFSVILSNISKLFQIKILFQIIINLCLHPENELSYGFYLKIKVRHKFINDNVNNEANQANIIDIVCHQCDVC